MGLSNELSCAAGSFFHCLLDPHRSFQSEALRLYFPVLEPWVAWSILLPSCSSQFICMQMWEPLLHQPPPCLPWSSRCCLASSTLSLGCPSPPLLLVWMNVFSLTPWLLDFHTVRFSGSYDCLLFLNCCPSFGCARRHSVSTYTSILDGSLKHYL